MNSTIKSTIFVAALFAITLLAASTALALEVEKKTSHCGLSADATLANIVSIEHLDGPLDGVILVVEDTNPLGAMPTLVLRVLFRPEPDVKDSCYALVEKDGLAKFHSIDLGSATVRDYDDNGGTLSLELIDDYHASYEPQIVKLKIDRTKKTVELL